MDGGSYQILDQDTRTFAGIFYPTSAYMYPEDRLVIKCTNNNTLNEEVDVRLEDSTDRCTCHSLIHAFPPFLFREREMCILISLYTIEED